MATFTFPTRTYNPGMTVLELTGAQLLTEVEVGFGLTATQWNAGRTLVGNIEESLDGGLTWKHAGGGTWPGPQVTDGSVVAGASVTLPPPEQVDRLLYQVRINLTLTGGTIRVAATVITR